MCPGASERGVASAEDTTASAWIRHHPTAPRGDTVPRVSRERGEAGDERRVLALQIRRGLLGSFRCESRCIP